MGKSQWLILSQYGDQCYIGLKKLTTHKMYQHGGVKQFYNTSVIENRSIYFDSKYIISKCYQLSVICCSFTI